MRIGFIVAMEEEFKSLKNIFDDSHVVESSPYKIYRNSYKNIDIIGIISRIGKAASSSATTILLSQYKCDLIINIGSCGGLNHANLSSVIVSNTAAYCDVDVSAFGYKIGQLPQQPEYFNSINKFVDYEHMLDYLKENNLKFLQGTVITCDSFISNKKKICQIKDIYPNTIAVEMEAASIAQICHHFNKDFILIKKVSDMADQEASTSFVNEITNIDKELEIVIDHITNYLSNNKK